MTTHRVLVNVMSSDWSVHFIAPDGRTRIGPWLLLESHDEARAILRWAHASPEEIHEHEESIRRWSISSVTIQLNERQYSVLVEQGKDWPWNGYELKRMKEAGRYPNRKKVGSIRAIRGFKQVLNLTDDADESTVQALPAAPPALVREGPG